MAINIHERPKPRPRNCRGAGCQSRSVVIFICNQQPLLSIINEGLVTMTATPSRRWAGRAMHAWRENKRGSGRRRSERVGADAFLFLHNRPAFCYMSKLFRFPTYGTQIVPYVGPNMELVKRFLISPWREAILSYILNMESNISSPSEIARTGLFQSSSTRMRGNRE